MEVLSLNSSKSLQVSLSSIRDKKHGLNAHRESILSRVPSIGDWNKYQLESLELLDLAFLTAYTGHEFAILRCKHYDILFHGNEKECSFTGELFDMLINKQAILFGHSHPGEDMPIPSKEDRDFLDAINQRESYLISGYSGKYIVFTSDPFEII